MKDFFLSWKFKVIICIFAVIIGFLIYAAIYGGRSSLPENILKSMIRPFSSAANSMTNWVEGKIDILVNANRYKEENEVLRAQLSQMYGQVKDVDNLKNENSELRRMLEIDEEYEDFEWAPPCGIISRNASDVFMGFTINRGSDDKIEVGDPVITNIGLVGIITDVAPTFAEVTTIISTEVKIGVMTVSERVVGVIENNLTYASEQKCLVNNIYDGSNMKIGDVVMTSGGSVYPAGIIVGEITEIYPDSNGLSLHAVVEPAVNLSGITECFVITSFEGQGVALGQ